MGRLELQKVLEAMKKKTNPMNKSRGFHNDKAANKYNELIEQARLKASQGDWDEAIQAYRKAELNKAQPTSKYINTLFTAAANAAQTGRYNEALELHCRLLALKPRHPDGLRNFSVVLRRLQNFSWAENFIKRYLEIRPCCPHGLNTLGTILTGSGRNPEAIKTFEAALALDPEDASAHTNLANEYHLQAKIDLAFTHSSRALKACTTNDQIWLDHLIHLRRVCDFNSLDRVNWWNLLERMHPTLISPCFLQVLVLAETFSEQKKLLKVINSWGDFQAENASREACRNTSLLPKNEAGALRIGFVSADFRSHSVARFIWPLFEFLDRSKFELYGYSTYPSNDAWRSRFNQSATAMRDVEALSPQELSQTIQDDGIHILFDLTGFTNNSRTSSFARRAAPVQVGWLGFPGSSGLPTMDYLFLDNHLAPSDSTLIREKALISKGTTVCFSQVDEVPITPEIPERIRGHLTLGTLNNSYKITRSTLERWARVLQKLPKSQFLFIRREFESYWLRQNIINEFELHGINQERIHFFNNDLAQRHYLDCYNEIDFTLDTFPVTGGTTTTDALWMGVPVVGLEGQNVHQRVCSAILHHAGHPEWIAHSDDEFVKIALDLAADQEGRIALRQSLRGELKSSLLCNAQQFADDFAAAMESLRGG